MTNDNETRVEQLARDAVDKAVAEDRAERRGFTITKFGKHEAGYFHARVTVDGRPIYMHLRYGSWMCPGEIGGRAVQKEIEALVVGTSVEGEGKAIKEALQAKVHTIEKAERLAREREKQQANGAPLQEDSNAAESSDIPDAAPEAAATTTGGEAN